MMIFQKKKKKKKMSRILNFYNWTSSFFYINKFKNFKFNKNHKKSLVTNYYNFDFFYEAQSFKKNYIKNNKFETNIDDEMYVYNLDLFNIDLDINHNNEVQFFILDEYDKFNKINKLKINLKYIKNDNKLKLIKYNKNKLIKQQNKFLSIKNLNCFYKLKNWL